MKPVAERPAVLGDPLSFTFSPILYPARASIRWRRR
jgi:hypothetical protein